MGRWRTPIYLRIGKGKDAEGQQKYAVLGAASFPLEMGEKTLAILKLDLDIDEAFLDPVTDLHATISMKAAAPDVADVVAGLHKIDKDVKDL
jgi:hypothetical protein